MAKIKTKKFRKIAPKPADKPPKYQAARRVKFAPIEVLDESEYKYEKKQ